MTRPTLAILAIAFPLLAAASRSEDLAVEDCRGCEAVRMSAENIWNLPGGPSSGILNLPDQTTIRSDADNCIEPSIFVQYVTSTNGKCTTSTQDTRECKADSSCDLKDLVTIQIPANSCYRELWVKGGDVAATGSGPGGAQRITATTPPITVKVSALCSTTGSNFDFEQVCVYTGENDNEALPAGIVTTAVSCTQCKK